MPWGLTLADGHLRAVNRAFCGLFALAGAVLMADPAAAANTPVAVTASARATVVSPLTLVWVQDLKFGRIIPKPQPGTVTVDKVTGVCTVTGPIIEVGKCQFAQFAGMGTKNMGARISLTTVANLTGPGQAMVLDQIALGTNSTISFTGNANANGGGVGLTKGGNAERYTITTNSGIYLLNVGGRLNVNANQAPGVYNGSITVSVQYQ